jgi:hypothetical protein
MKMQELREQFEDRSLWKTSCFESLSKMSKQGIKKLFPDTEISEPPLTFKRGFTMDIEGTSIMLSPEVLTVYVLGGLLIVTLMFATPCKAGKPNTRTIYCVEETKQN